MDESCLGGITGCGFMEAWDIIVVGDGPAALRAASAAAKQGASTLMVAVNALGSTTDAGREGLAASIHFYVVLGRCRSACLVFNEGNGV